MKTFKLFIKTTQISKAKIELLNMIDSLCTEENGEFHCKDEDFLEIQNKINQIAGIEIQQ